MTPGHSGCARNVIEHYECVWNCIGKAVRFAQGPVAELPPDFTILEFEPHGGRTMWTYATAGMSSGDIVSPLELHMFSECKSMEIVEILVATAHFHRTGNALGLGHLVNFGKPWVSGSICQRGLVSLPYLDGPPLEELKFDNRMLARCLWLIPIADSEMQYILNNGTHAIEQLFEASSFNYADPFRDPVC